MRHIPVDAPSDPSHPPPLPDPNALPSPPDARCVELGSTPDGRPIVLTELEPIVTEYWGQRGRGLARLRWRGDGYFAFEVPPGRPAPGRGEFLELGVPVDGAIVQLLGKVWHTYGQSVRTVVVLERSRRTTRVHVKRATPAS